MKHVRILGLCLVAALALAALVAAGSASAAEPEWGHCIALKKSEYTNSSCTTKSAKAHKGKYEWIPGAQGCYAMKKGEYTNSSCTSKSATAHKGSFEKTHGGRFKSKSAAEPLPVLWAAVYVCEAEEEVKIRAPRGTCTYDYYDQLPEARVECKEEQAEGEATGSDEVTNIKTRFTGCTFEHVHAETPGYPNGEVVVNTLKGRLGYIDKSAKTVGVLLEPASAGGLFAELEIPEVAGTVIKVGVGNATEGSFYEELGPGDPSGRDGVISPIEPVDQMTSQFTQHYTKLFTPQALHEVVLEGEHVLCEAPLACGKFENVPNKFEGATEPIELLEMYPSYEGGAATQTWSSAAQELTTVNTVTEGAAEIKA